jgi:hypothetical protein
MNKRQAKIEALSACGMILLSSLDSGLGVDIGSEDDYERFYQAVTEIAKRLIERSNRMARRR